MTKSALIAVAVALLLCGTSIASAKNRRATHSMPVYAGTQDALPRAIVADPYYRLSDSYYGYSDPYRGLFDVYAVPPYNPGGAYGYVRPIGR